MTRRTVAQPVAQREFAELAFACAGLDWRKHVEIDSSYFRPNEVNFLLGDASKARKVLGWEPKVRFPELVKIMVEADIQMLRGVVR